MTSIQSPNLHIDLSLELVAIRLPIPAGEDYRNYVRSEIDNAVCHKHHREGIKTLLSKIDTKIRIKKITQDNTKLGIRHAEILSNASKNGTPPNGIGSGNNVANNGKEINIFVPQNMPDEYNFIYIFAKIPRQIYI
jgi:hypothetical protein